MNKVKKVLGVALVLGLFLGFTKFSLAEEKGLVGYWKFDEGKGKVAKDSSGMGNDGAISGAAWVKGVSGSALQFDGKDDYVNCGKDESLNLTSAITIEAWVKVDSHTGGSYNTISDRSLPIFRLRSNGELEFHIADEDGNLYAPKSRENIPFNEWVHIATSYDSSSGKVYFSINGVRKLSTCNWPPAGKKLKSVPSQVLYLARYRNTGNRAFHGAIDEVKIYNYARTGNEIKKDYNVGEINVFKGRIDKLMFSLKKTLDLTKEERKSLRIRIEGIERKLSEISHYLNSTLSIPEQILEKKAEEISRLKMRISQIEYYLSLSKEERKSLNYTVGIATSLDKVFKDRVWDKSLIKELRLQMAVNEYESAQVVITPLIDELKEVKVTCSDLISEEGKKIASDNIDIRPVGYVYLSSEQSWYPDPLLRNRSFDIASDQAVQPVWVTVYTPTGTMPGEYKGTLTICPSNSPAEHLPVSVEVWGFKLSQELLPTDFSFRPPQIVMFYYGSRGMKNVWEYMPAPLCRKYLKFLLRYRISPQLFDEGGEQRNRAFVSYLGWRWEEDKLILDFDEFDKNVELLRRNGARFIRVGYFSGRPGKFWQSYLPQIHEHIKQKGWSETFYFYLKDEPTNTEQFEIVKEQSALVVKLAPGLKRLGVYSNSNFEKYFADSLDKYIDIWVPHLSLGFRKSFQKERKKKGEAVWPYITSHFATPNFLIRRPAIEHRVLFWLLEKYKADGFLYWGTSVWQPMTINDIEEDGSPKKSWNPYEGRFPSGDGYLTYPAGKNIEDGLNPSIRLEAIRDGLEDWEYFRLLKERLKELKMKGENKYHGLIKETERLLEIEDSIVKGEYTFTKDPQKIYEKRGNVACQIEKINQILRER